MTSNFSLKIVLCKPFIYVFIGAPNPIEELGIGDTILGFEHLGSAGRLMKIPGQILSLEELYEVGDECSLALDDSRLASRDWLCRMFPAAVMPRNYKVDRN